MELPQTPDDDVLALPVRARLFEALADLRRPGSTEELAALVRRHPNTVRLQLQRLADAGLLERRFVPQARGRPRHAWVLAPTARPGGRPPEAHGHLSRWLARALGDGGAELDRVEQVGREIGRELAPEQTGRGVRQAMHDALTALGFAPDAQAEGDERVRYELGNCPYRDAVRVNQPAVCTLHRGLTRGLLDQLAPQATLSDFVARDPYAAGCLIEVAGIPPGAGA